METKGELAKAIIEVMKEVTNIEKSMTVGAGTASSYKGVSDKDVKLKIGNSMQKHGLCMIPINIDAKTTIERWEEEDQWSKTIPKAKKTKQSVFVETSCRYLLLHTSGEYAEVAGYGHGVDSQDKAAGKATTYSMKNALLYTFMVPTGEIDDTDKTHSDDIPVPPTQIAPPSQPVTAQNNNLELSEELKTIGEKVGTIKTLIALEAYWNDDLTTEQKANEIVKNLFGKRKLQLKAK
jgi:hypothetical protein